MTNSSRLLILFLVLLLLPNAFAVTNVNIPSGGNIATAVNGATLGTSGDCVTSWLTVHNAGICAIVANGAYTGPIAISKTGTSTQRVVIISATQYGAVITNPELDMNGSFMDVLGFNMTAPTDIYVQQEGPGASFNTFQYNYVHDVLINGCHANGVLNDIGSQTNPTSHNTYNANIIRHWGTTNTTACPSPQSGFHGLYTDGGAPTITNNIFSGGSGGWAIQKQYTTGASGSACLPGIIANNTIFNNLGGIVINQRDGSGAPVSCSFSGWSVINNIIVNNGIAGTGSHPNYGIDFFRYDSGNASLFSNNMIYGNLPADIFNNTGNTPATLQNPKTDASTSITFANFRADVNSAPVSSYNANDYSLKAGSAAVQGGGVTCASGGITPCVPTLDFARTNRSNPPSVGAFEFIQGSTPCGTTGITLTPNASCVITVTFHPTASGNRTGAVTIVDNASGSPHTVGLTGTGTAGATSFSPTSIPFGTQTVGSSSGAITETLTNNGTATLTGITISLTGTNTGDYSIVNHCGTTLAVNVSCTIDVTFTPTTSGSRTANLHFVSSALNSPQDVPLTGTGSAITFSVTTNPNSLTFTSQSIGTTSPVQTILVTSSGSGTVAFSSIAKTGTDASQFNLVNPCGASLPAGNSCTLSVSFSPTTIGTKNASITLTDNASDSPQVITLTGTATTPPAPVVSLSPSSLTFASRNVSTTSASQPITVNNIGTATLTTSISATGDYTQTNNCSSVIAGAFCTINVTFTPTAIGTRTGSVSIVDNAAGSPHTVSLTGTGLGASGGVSPTTLPFGNQGVNASSPAQNVTLTNSGNIAQSITITFTGANAGEFSQTSNCSGNSVPAGTNCNIAVTFAPLSTGSKTASLVITSNALNSPQTVTLTGTGVQASLSISPTLLPFGNQPAGTSSAFQTTTVTNIGTVPATITNVSVTGSNNTEFILGTNTCLTTLQPSASCHVLVQFAPATIGIKSAAITIADNALGSPHTVNLTGTGTSVIASFSPPSISFGNTPVGTQTAGVTSTLTNTGTANYTITSIGIGSGGNPGDFSQTNNCPATLAPSVSCVVTAKFLPTAAGNRAATVNVVGNINVNLPLGGVGTVSGTSFTPSPVAFGDQTSGTSNTKTTVLLNTGLAPLHISSSSMVKTGCSADLNDNFNTGTLDLSKWVIDTGTAPGSITGVNSGTFSASNVDMSQGVLTLRVNQSSNNPVISSGAEVRSLTTYGFGTFEWVLRTASTATTPVGVGLSSSGQISSGFNFINNSQTEIDFEIEGQFPNLVEQTTWFTTATNQETNYNAPFAPDQGFHHYKYVWTPGIVQYFVDGVLSATHTNNVPIAPAFVLMNLWGTNSTSFGGNANVGVARRMFFSQFTHTPATCGPSTTYTQTNNCPGTLNPASSCTYNVTFTPAVAGESDAFLQVNTDAPVSPSLTLMTGNGVSPTVVLSPSTFDFGNVSLGITSTSTTFSVINNGTGPATISSVSVSGAEFSIQSQNCVGTLGVTASCSIAVDFTPSATGLRTSTLTVNDNAAGHPHTSALRGTGVNSGGATSLILGGAMDAGGNLQIGVH